MGIAWDPATSTTTTMNTFLFFSSLIAFARTGTVAVALAVVANAAPYLVRAPAHDSASIEHHRLGGNFAYSTAEAHAFAEVVPQISTLTHPVAETTHTHIPAPIAPHQPVPTHQTVHQPIVHETRTHTVQAVSQAVATPVHAVAEVPVAVAHAAPVALAAYAAAPVAHAAGYAAAPVAAGYAGLGYTGLAGHGYAA